MADEHEPAAWRVLPSGSRAVLALIGEIAGHGEAAIPKRNFVAHGAHGIGPGMVRDALIRLSRLRFIEIDRGRFGSRPVANVFRLSEGWRDISEAEAKKLVHIPRKPGTKRLMKKLAQQKAEAAASQPRRRNFADDQMVRRVAESARARPAR
jgi:hypothetical protein